MKNVLTAAKLLVSDIAKLEAPTLAMAVATPLVPIIAAVAGANITAAELGGWFILAGTVAATLQNLFSGRAAAARKPAPVPVVPAPVIPPVKRSKPAAK